MPRKSAEPRPGEADFTPELGEAVLAWVREGNPLAEFARKAGTPTRRTVHAWRHRHPEFKEAYDAARLEGFEAIAEDCQDLANRVTPERDAVAKAKLQIETRLKLLSKWYPAKYGDKQTVDLNVNDVQKLTDEQLNARLEQFAAEAARGNAAAAGGEAEADSEEQA